MERDAAERGAVLCPACGKPVDTLRAGHVAILNGAFAYFCDEACKRAFVAQGPLPPPSQVETAEPPRVAPRPAAPLAPIEAVERDVESPNVPAAPELAPPPSEPAEPVAPAGSPPVTPSVIPSAPPSARRAAPPYLLHGTTLVGVLAGCIAPSLALLGPSAQGARFTFASVALLACCVRALVAPRDPSDAHPVVAVLSVAAVWAVAFLSRDEPGARALRFASVAGLAAAVHLVSAVVVDRAREGVRSARAWIRRRLDVPVTVLRAGRAVVVPAAEVRPGEEVTAVAGDILGVDVMVVAGAARVTPWLDAPVETSRKEGDALVAGARLASGSVRAVTTWSGADRAWLKLVETEALRPDVVGPIPRRVRSTVERGALVAAAVVAGLAVANRASGIDALMIAAVAFFCVAGTWAVSIVALHQARGPLSALAHGVVYRDAASFDAAGRTDTAVLCARLTLLMGAPEMVALEAFGSLEVGRVLAFVAGSSTVSAHASSAAFLEAARARGESPEAVRHATYHQGLGVTALATNGDRLVVGSRALLLREKVSIALADSRVAQLEAEGRSVTLVALGGKLVGLVALQDGLRPGARAAIQRLLDAGIEPVLLSGEARDTCETIGRAVDIEHVRPEVLPQDRAKEVRALADGGHVVGVLGYPDADGGALGAADVSVALGAAGASPGEWGVSLASGDVRDAARALSIAVETRKRTLVAIAVGLAPGAVISLAIALGLAPLALGPIVSLAAVVAAAAHARR